MTEEKTKAVLEAFTKQLQQKEEEGSLTPDSFFSLIENNIPDTKPYYTGLLEAAEKTKLPEKEKNIIIKKIKKLRFSNWSVASHRIFSEQYTTLNSYYPTGYNGIIELSPQTLCTIPARTGHGKTAVMINLFLDCIEQKLQALKENPEQEQYPVIFLSLEMSSEQVGKRILSNRIKAAYDILTDPAGETKLILDPLPCNSDEINLPDYMTATDKLDSMRETGPEDRKHNVETLEKRLRKNMKKLQAIKDGKTLLSLDKCYREACSRLEIYEKNDLFFLGDTEIVTRSLSGENGIKEYLKAFPHSVVFIDYLQLMESTRDYTSSWQSIKEICNELCDIAKKNDQIIITGAQFNRDTFASCGDFALPEKMELSGIREGADIEQASNTVFAIGKALNKKEEITYFWKLLKNRDGENQYQSFLYYSDMMYCTLRSTAEPAAGLKTSRGKKEKEEAGKEAGKKFFTPKDEKGIFQNVNIFLKEKKNAAEIRKEMAEQTKAIFEKQEKQDIEKALQEAYRTIMDGRQEDPATGKINPATGKTWTRAEIIEQNRRKK